MKRSELTGQRFNRLTALDCVARKRNGKTRIIWRCLCDCGKETRVAADALKSGTTKSCGCLRKETISAIGRKHTLHGDTANGQRSPEYMVHTSLIQRTTNPKHKVFASYGGNGRSVCARLRSFIGFLGIVGRRPTKRHSIDRIKNSGGYWCGLCSECKTNKWSMNVRWATPEEQRQNMDDAKLLTINGETHCVAEWERIAGLPVDRIRARLKYGWPVDESLLQPPKYNTKADRDARKKTKAA